MEVAYWWVSGKRTSDFFGTFGAGVFPCSNSGLLIVADRFSWASGPKSPKGYLYIRLAYRWGLTVLGEVFNAHPGLGSSECLSDVGHRRLLQAKGTNSKQTSKSQHPERRHTEDPKKIRKQDAPQISEGEKNNRNETLKDDQNVEISGGRLEMIVQIPRPPFSYQPNDEFVQNISQK